jgi:hypothetical protein
MGLDGTPLGFGDSVAMQDVRDRRFRVRALLILAIRLRSGGASACASRKRGEVTPEDTRYGS